ncbi:MAG TPA: UDP-N-acetylmuramate dehydrogenase [Acidimicrobiia bacterium]|jgi:UDP-N-acetylmuramate dehydrogenase|nr:UDP-N-acetylmuramate dehydrogenase [Acidimicrobiia bacterium]
MSPDRPPVATGLVREGVPLGPLTTYKAGGPARLFAEVESIEDLMSLVDSGLTREHPLLVLGRGSNLLVADDGFDGLVVHLGLGFAAIEVSEDRVEAGGAAPLPRVARTAVEAGVLGLEFFVGVPGSVGGAVRQNAGCFDVETTDRLITARILDLADGTIRESGPSQLDLSYRHSNVSADEVILSARFQGEKGPEEDGKRLMREITRWRKENQPGGTLNAGSVFKNPPGMAAGDLIDRLGLKGMAIGSVSVSEKHANFFVAGPDATSAQIRELVERVKDTVLERSGTMLEPEIQFVGFVQ